MIISAKAEKGEYMEEMGMTNEQYKGMLLDELEVWSDMLKLAKNSETDELVEKVQQ